MNAISSISLSGMQAAQTRLDASAHNIANQQTEGFQPLEVQQSTQQGGGVSSQVERSSSSSGAGPSLEDDVVAQLQAKNSFLANLNVFKTNDSMMGSLLNIRA
jgi:flagellar hook protein FlgE